MPPAQITDDRLKLVLAYIQCIDTNGVKVDWQKMAELMGLSSGIAASARFTRFKDSHKDTDLYVGGRPAKASGGSTAAKPTGVTKKRNNKNSAASTSKAKGEATDGTAKAGRGVTRIGRGGGRTKGRMETTLDPLPSDGNGNSAGSDGDEDHVSVKSEKTENGDDILGARNSDGVDTAT